MEREYVSFTTGAVVHVRDGDLTLCGRRCEGFGDPLDASLWHACPALRCAQCNAKRFAPRTRREATMPSVMRFGMRYFGPPYPEPFYIHPNGYRIKREHQGFDGRSPAHRTPGVAKLDRSVMWNVYRKRTRDQYPVQSFTTLREARSWCDAHDDRYSASTEDEGEVS